MSTPEFEVSRQFWERARDFPPNKESPHVYGRAHTTAQDFDYHAGLRVLEYGCGGGADAMSYLRRRCDVTYCDIVPANVVRTTERIEIEATREPQLPRGHPVVLPASAPLPFPDGVFDLVNAHGVLHHIWDPAPVVAEFFRVLRPDGWVYAMLYTDNLFERCRSHVESLMGTGLTCEQAFGAVTDGSGCPYARPYTKPQGHALLESAGFFVDKAFVYNDGDFCTYRGRKP